MRTLFFATAAAVVAAACNPAQPTKEVTAPPGPATAPAPAAMDAAMKSHDAADDVATAETPDGHMFHTGAAKVELVHLSGAGVWTATLSDPALVAISPGVDEAMPDGTKHHVFRLTPRASGNASVTFERRETAAGPVAETRTVQVMIH